MQFILQRMKHENEVEDNRHMTGRASIRYLYTRFEGDWRGKIKQTPPPLKKIKIYKSNIFLKYAYITVWIL